MVTSYGNEKTSYKKEIYIVLLLLRWSFKKVWWEKIRCLVSLENCSLICMERWSLEVKRATTYRKRYTIYNLLPTLCNQIKKLTVSLLSFLIFTHLIQHPPPSPKNSCDVGTYVCLIKKDRSSEPIWTIICSQIWLGWIFDKLCQFCVHVSWFTKYMK